MKRSPPLLSSYFSLARSTRSNFILLETSNSSGCLLLRGVEEEGEGGKGNEIKKRERTRKIKSIIGRRKKKIEGEKEVEQGGGTGESKEVDKARAILYIKLSK